VFSTVISLNRKARPEMEIKYIVHAAIMRDGNVIESSRHFQCIRKATENYGWLCPITQKEQGFTDQDGTFYTRDQARIIAKIAGQIPMDFNRTLLSEDLW
jgi:hypothetical protein